MKDANNLPSLWHYSDCMLLGTATMDIIDDTTLDQYKTDTITTASLTASRTIHSDYNQSRCKKQRAVLSLFTRISNDDGNGGNDDNDDNGNTSTLYVVVTDGLDTYHGR